MRPVCLLEGQPVAQASLGRLPSVRDGSPSWAGIPDSPGSEGEAKAAGGPVRGGGPVRPESASWLSGWADHRIERREFGRGGLMPGCPGSDTGSPRRRPCGLVVCQRCCHRSVAVTATLTSVGDDANRSDRGRAQAQLRTRQAQERTRQAQERIDQLAQRRRELAAQIGDARGSGVEQVRVARDNLDRARQAAEEAADLAADALESSALTHDRAALLYEQIAGAGLDDPADQRRRAAEHHRAASDDRALAKDARAEASRHREADPP
jgi:hypothetical protein